MCIRDSAERLAANLRGQEGGPQARPKALGRFSCLLSGATVRLSRRRAAVTKRARSSQAPEPRFGAPMMTPNMTDAHSASDLAAETVATLCNPRASPRERVEAAELMHRMKWTVPDDRLALLLEEGSLQPLRPGGCWCDACLGRLFPAEVPFWLASRGQQRMLRDHLAARGPAARSSMLAWAAGQRTRSRIAAGIDLELVEWLFRQWHEGDVDHLPDERNLDVAISVAPRVKAIEYLREARASGTLSTPTLFQLLDAGIMSSHDLSKEDRTAAARAFALDLEGTELEIGAQETRRVFRRLALEVSFDRRCFDEPGREDRAAVWRRARSRLADWGAVGVAIAKEVMAQCVLDETVLEELRDIERLATANGAPKAEPH